MLRTTHVPALAGLLGVFLVCAGLHLVASQVAATVPKPPPAPAQPLPYSHRFHVGDLGLECAECHTNPGAGKLMTYPPTSTCTSCHRSNPAGSQSLQALSTMAGAGNPIPWVRVYQLPDYVYWQHGPHLAAKVGCTECHGPVGERDVVALETDVTTMRGCQRCHEKRQVFTDCGDCHEPRQ